MNGWKVAGLWKTMSSASSAWAASMSPFSTAARNSLAALMPRSLPVGFAPHLDRDLLDAERDRRLGLRRLDPHALEVVVGQQPLGDRRAQPLERAMRALLGDQRDELAHLGVVDGVFDRVGDGRVGLADVEPQVEHEPLTHLTLGLADAVVR